MPLLNKQLADANRSNNTRRRIWLTAYAPLIIWTIIVLGLGSGLGAANETSRIIRPILEFIFPTASFETISIIHGWIRKFAHFAEYAVLGLLALRALVRSRIAVLSHMPFIAALIFTALIAFVDEFRQSFDPSRTGSIYDVLIDIAGGFTAIFAVYVFSRRGGNGGRSLDAP